MLLSHDSVHGDHDDNHSLFSLKNGKSKRIAFLGNKTVDDENRMIIVDQFLWPMFIIFKIECFILKSISKI